MTPSLRLDIRQSQSLVLTPQLQQAIRLLQMSSVELAGTIDRELAENPFLERAETVEEARRRVEREREIGGTPAPVSGRPGDADEGWAPPPTPSAADRRLRVTSASGSFAEPDTNPESQLARGPTLAEHLRAQIVTELVDRRVRDVAIALVDWLDEDGYLREADDALAERLGVTAMQVAEARDLLLRCEPAGIGARDLRQCLAAQLADRNRLDPAMRALLDHLPLVARADFASLQRICGVDLEDVREMIAEIKGLDPRPGLAFALPEPIDVVPDLVVYRAGRRDWYVRLNPAGLPRVLVDRDYYASLTRGRLERQEREFVSERYQAANWLVKALDQRARTILRVGRAIFERQRPFLEHGPSKLRPLVLRKIAEGTGLHESTVSRATAGKFVATPWGTFPLRYFFSASIAAAEGQECHSAEAVRQRIKRMIDNEDPASVLSDDQLVLALKADGVVIARRTVAKYRESLGIPSSLQRRRSKAFHFRERAVVPEPVAG